MRLLRHFEGPRGEKRKCAKNQNVLAKQLLKTDENDHAQIKMLKTNLVDEEWEQVPQ
jgi:hypothetical protein